MRDLLTVSIDGRRVGDGSPCLIVAEVGSNHNQDLSLALKLIDTAAACGADAVKFQTFAADQHYSRHTPGFSYLDNIDTHGLIKSLELNRDWQGRLKEHAEAQGLIFFSSPCDEDAIAGLERLDAPAYKIASFDLTDLDLVGRMARIGRPLILSTGMADWGDIGRAVQRSRAEGNNQIILLQCTSLYPAPPALANLAAMGSMRAAMGTLVGYSDHTEDDHVALASVALGACMIERHFTLDKTLPGPDHPFAIEPDALSRMVRRIRDIEAALGDGCKFGPRPEESEMAMKGRRSLHAKRRIATGDVISEDMVCVKRPGLGIAPYLKHQVIGRTARRDIEADHWLTWDAL